MTSFYKDWVVWVALIAIFSIGGCAGKETFRSGSPAYWPTEKWRTSSPEDQNMDSAVLDKMDSDLGNNYPLMRSVIVIRNGYIVFEKYYLGDADVMQALESATKSITSALIGIAYDKGYMKGIDQKIIDYFPEYAEETGDERFNEISIRHLLTMSAGFDTRATGNRGMKECFTLPIVFTPGSEARYNTCESHILSGIITKTTKMNALDFGYAQLFKPLGIPRPHWENGHDGYSMGGYGAYLKSRDMAKIGYLYLHNGVWDGNQIISANWVKDSTQEQVRLQDQNVEYASIGYQWFVTSPDGYYSFFAMGYGGQYIRVIPDLNMVIIVTADYSYETGFFAKHHDVVGSYSIAAVFD